MHPYLLIPVLSAVTAAAFATALLVRDPHHPRNRYAAMLLFATSYWAVCEVVWNSARDADTAIWWVRASAPGWIWAGALFLRVFADREGGGTGRAARILPWMFAGGLVVLGIEWTTPWMHSRAVRMSWGWGYEVGPAFQFWYAYVIALVSAGVVLVVREWRLSDSPAERRQRPWLLGAVAIPMTVASLTDGILPILGIQTPRLGSASLAAMGGLIVWSQLRYGYSLLVPGHFAREILEVLPEGVALLLPDGRIRTANPGVTRLLGESAGRLLGRSFEEFAPAWSAAPEEEIREQECELRPPGRRPIPVALSCRVLRDRQGLVLGSVVIARDLREVAALRSRLVLSGRLAAVGQLAAGIAHEINNPLAFVRTNLALLEEHWRAVSDAWRKERPASECDDVLEEGSELIAESLEGVDRTAAIVRDVRNFSHAGEDRDELLDLRRLLEEALRILSPKLRGPIELRRRYGEIPPVTGSSQEIRQLFVNLVANGLQALGDAGHLTVTTVRQEGHAVVLVEDDGPGIATDLLDRIFDPFFTTKPVGEGTGLGLAISHEIVQRHGGEIRVSSEPGRGTRFEVRLPAAELP